MQRQQETSGHARMRWPGHTDRVAGTDPVTVAQTDSDTVAAKDPDTVAGPA